MRFYPLTFLLIAVNAIVFFVDQSQGNRLIDMGAMSGPAVAHGQTYRLFTSAFLHFGLPHLLVNMMSLYFMGTFTESVLGSFKTLIIYIASLLGSSLAVYHFAFLQDTVGASGAIFGLFGALFAIGLRAGSGGRDLLRQAVPILLINLGLTFFVPGISIAGHLGGLITGFVFGLLLFRPQRPVYAHVVDATTGEQLESQVEQR